MLRFNHDFSSRFRILKGGKVSLVMSAMLLGAISADAGTLTNASIVPNSNVVGAKTNYTFSFTTASEVTADNYVLYAWLPSNFSFSHTSGTSDNNNFAILCSDVVESITVDGFLATCDAARSWSSPAPTAVQISLDSVVPSGTEVVVKLKNINNSTAVGSSDFVMLGTSLPGGILDGYSSKTVSLVDGTVFSATVNTSSQVLDINSTHGEPGAWDDYINLNNNSSCSIATGKHYYQTQTFIATQDANHTIDTASLNGFFNEDLAIGDNFMAVYQGVFDPSNPTANLVGCNDDIDYDNNNLFARFSTDLTTGQAYTMVFTSSMSPEYVDTYFAYSNPEGAITGNGTFAVSPAVSLAYSLSGTVSGLENGETLTLSGVGSTDKVISANGNFIFDTPLANSANYNITATLSGTSNQFRTCTVSNGSGAINSANVNNISVSCAEDVNQAPTFSYQNGISHIPESTAIYQASGFKALDDGSFITLGRTATGGFDSLSTEVKFFLTKYKADGSIDTAFGTDGKTVVSLGQKFIDSIAFTTLSDGKILVSGTERANNSHTSLRTIFLARFNANGTTDTSFGTNGISYPTLNPGGIALGGTQITTVSNLLPLSNGKAIITGHEFISSKTQGFAVTVNGDGTMDASFGPGGRLIDQSQIHDAILDSDGKLIVVGGGVYVNPTDYSAKISRILTDGAFDSSFGTGGTTVVDIPEALNQDFRTVALQSDGKIIATMHANGPTRVYRFNTNGTVDSTFNNNTGYLDLGSAFSPYRVTGLTVDDSDNIFVTGNIYATYTSKVAKITPNGTLDTTFGTNGVLEFNVYGGATSSENNGRGMEGSIELTKATDGKMLILGNVGSGYSANSGIFSTDQNIYIGKIDSDGVFDRDFGAPVNSLGNTALFKEGESAISLAPDATLVDKDLRDTNYGGVVVSLSRQGGANANDIFGATGNLTLQNGDVNVSATKIGTFTNTDGNLTLTFNSSANQTAVNEALKSITYENNATVLPSSVVIAWSVTDNNGGSQGSGGVLIGEGNTTVNIQRTPKVSGAGGIVTEDGSITFNLNNFGTYSPLGSETSFSYIKIISLPTNGVLKNDGSEVSVGDTIYSSDIEDSYLTFTPNANVYGSGAGNFTFQVGVNSSQTGWQTVWSQTYTMDLNVSGINDTPTFKVSEGSSYIELPNFSIDDYARESMKVLSNGKILVAGKSPDSISKQQFDIRRYNADWTLDSSFGTNGIATFDMGTSSDDYPTNMTVDSSGNIYLTGMARGSSRDFAIVKLDSNGALVSTFGDSGKKILDLGNSSNDYARKIMVLDSGEIIAIGYDSTPDQAVLVKLSASGELVNTFGTNGILYIAKVGVNDYDSFNSATLWTIDGEQKILLSVPEVDNTNLNRLMVLNTDGTPYATFATNGIFSQSDQYFYSFLPLNDGNMLVGGYDGNQEVSKIFKLTPTGTLETLVEFSFESRINEIKKDSEGNFYAVADSNGNGALVAKFSSNGVLDASFGTNGIKTFTIPNANESSSNSIEFDINGNLLVYTTSYVGNNEDTLSAIAILDKTTGELKTIGGESSLGQTITHNRATPIVLDSDATIKDAELDAISYNGAIITLARDGGANPQDIFSFTDAITVSGNTLILGATSVGTFSLNDGNMTITFNDVNTTVVNTTLRNITYHNSGSEDENVTIAWNFSDGNGATDGGQGSGGAKITMGMTKAVVSGIYVSASANSVSLSVPYKTGTTEVSIISPTGTNITGATNNPSPTGVTRGVTLPLGSFAFNVGGLTNGQTVTMSMIVDKAIGSYAYYKKNNLTNRWVNITKSVTFLTGADAGKVKIDFDLKDGGAFDSDGVANGTIVDPGGIASNTLTPYLVEGTTLVGDASFVDDSNNNNFSGTIAYSISGGADADKFTINSTTGALSFKTAPSFTNPTDLGDIAGNNTYAVEVSVAGSTSGRESRAITVSVLSATGSNTPKAIAPAISSDNITIGKGSVNGSTKITYTPASGNTIKYIFSADEIAIPSYDASLPNGATTYTSGSNIEGARSDRYLTVYEIDENGNIVGYYQEKITKDVIFGEEIIPNNLSFVTPIPDKVLDIASSSSFRIDLRDYIENAVNTNVTTYSFERVQSTESIAWLSMDSVGVLSTSGTVPVGVYYIKVIATSGEDTLAGYFTIRAKDLTTSLATYITKPTGAINTTGTESGKTFAETTLNNTDAKVYADGSASHMITGISEATSELPDSTVVVSDAGDVTTSTTTINTTGDIVDIKVEGKISGDDKAIHTLKVGNKETVAKSKIIGTTTTIKEDRTVETKATVSGNEAKATALPDGTATHIITVGGFESKATIEIAGAQTVIDTTGITTSVDENQTIDGNAITVKSIVKTDTLGESQTWFEDSNGVQLERTVSAHTPLESGATVNVSKDTNGKLQFKIKTKVTRDLTIE